MRILHTSDWHLGRTLHGADLAGAHEAFFDHLVEVVVSEGVDAVVVAGDVYDRAIPPAASVALLTDALGRLASRTRVVLTPGNHDSAVRLGFAAGLLGERLAIRTRVADVGTPVVLPAADGSAGAYLYALPYLDPDLARAELAEPGAVGEAEVPARSHEAVLGAAMGRVRADLARRRSGDAVRVPALVAAHAFVAGGAVSASERDIRVGGVDVVPSAVFAAPGAGAQVDYVALGHLHGAQRVGGAVAARYSGSPLAFSFSEEHHEKSSVIVDLGAQVRTTLVAAPVTRRLASVRGTLAELTSGAFAAHAGHWLRVAVTDATRPRHMRARLLEHLPHVLALSHEPEGALPVAGARAITARQDPVQVASQFIADAGGAAATAAEREVLRGAVEAATAGQGADR